MGRQTKRQILSLLFWIFFFYGKYLQKITYSDITFFDETYLDITFLMEFFFVWNIFRYYY